MAPSAHCAPAPCSAKSPTASAPSGEPRSTPTSAPSSRPLAAVPSAPSKQSVSPSRARPSRFQHSRKGREQLLYLYIIIDIFSRRIVAWQIADAESAALFKPLFDDAIVKHDVVPGQLTLHADRGGPMKAKATALLLADLGVTKSHSRPYTSNDHPFSESHFKTLKYQPQFPQRFGCIEDAKTF